MKALVPWNEMTGFRKEMDRFLDRFWDEEIPALAEWTPPLEISETKEGLVVRLEVPGIDPKDIRVTLQEQLLMIEGEKKQEKEEKEERFHRLERSYGSFTRTIRLPTFVDESKVSATFKNGVLKVMLTKVPSTKGKMIQIQAN